MPYRRSNSLPLSDQERADSLAECFKSVAADDSNAAALFHAFFSAKPTVRRLVARRFATTKRPGAPRKGLPDLLWLEFVEVSKGELLAYLKATGKDADKVTDFAAIEYGLADSGTRYGRRPGERFNRAEIIRIRDAAVRARRAKKTEIPPKA